MKIKKLYLSGPMTGYPELNAPAFNAATKKLRRRGFKVINPPELDAIEKADTWEGCLRRDLRFLVDCDAIATLPNWTKSRGANLEIYVGKALSMPVHKFEYYLRGK